MILHYKDLYVVYWHCYHEATIYAPEDWDYTDDYIEYDYEVEEEDVIEALTIISKNKEEYIKEHLEELFKKYNKELLEFFRGPAETEANNKEE